MFRAVTRLGVAQHIRQHAQRNFGFTAVVAKEAEKAPEEAPAASSGSRITDPIQKLFLEKLREYKSKATGGKLVDATPTVEARLKDELDKVDRMFGAKGQDMTQFPTFQFSEPKLEPVGLGEVRDLEPAEGETEFEEEEEDNKPYFSK